MSGAGNSWRGIIGGLRGREHLYDNMPPPGGFTATSPAAVSNSAGHSVTVVYGKGGKKIIKKVSSAQQEEKKITIEEAMESPDKMFKYLKRYNKREDKKFEEKELNAFKDDDDGI